MNNKAMRWTAFLAPIGFLFTTACESDVEAVNWDTSAVHDVPAQFDEGFLMRDAAYSDMPYLLATNGKILSTITVSSGEEGANDQHIELMQSLDGGQTWSTVSTIEPAEGPEASWAMPFLDRDELGVVYTYNTDDVRSWPMDNGVGRARVDMLGDFAFRFSKDDGETWSDREVMDVPYSSIDARNGFKGEETIFWLSGAPIRGDGRLYIGFSKGGSSTPRDILPDTEVFLLHSDAPSDISSWQLMPASGRGLTAPDGSGVSEEPSLAILPDGSLYVVFRTTAGKLAKSVSTDNGATWETDWAKFSNGTNIYNPRAKSVVKEVGGGRFVLWFHNNDSKGFERRNPVWMSCGIAVSGDIEWSPPKIILSDPDPTVRMSYPSILMEEETVLIAATKKSTARVFRFRVDDICL